MKRSSSCPSLRERKAFPRIVSCQALGDVGAYVATQSPLTNTIECNLAYPMGGKDETEEREYLSCMLAPETVHQAPRVQITRSYYEMALENEQLKQRYETWLSRVRRMRRE